MSSSLDLEEEEEKRGGGGWERRDSVLKRAGYKCSHEQHLPSERYHPLLLKLSERQREQVPQTKSKVQEKNSGGSESFFISTFLRHNSYPLLSFSLYLLHFRFSNFSLLSIF